MKTSLKALKALTLASVAATAPFFVFSPPAGAGTNGQQVEVKASILPWWVCPAGIKVTVSGYNQSNQYATRTVYTGCNGIATTNNSWWKGNVTVNTYSNVFGSKTCYANVPVNQNGNWYRINCY